MPEHRKLTPAEIGLMRQIVAWRKANDIEFDPTMPRWVRRGRDHRSVVASFVNGEMATCGIGSVLFRWTRVDSLTEAVDVLVAYGYLPARFSTAYRAGWDARHEAATVACRDGMGVPGINSPEVRALEPAVKA